MAVFARSEPAELDETAFVALIEPVLPAAHRLAVAMLHSNAEAEDAVQEAVFRAWRHFSSFRQEADMKPWLLTIVANECRRNSRRRWTELFSWRIESYLSTVRHAPDTPESAADLRQAISRLPLDQRLVIVLRYYLDLPFDEVAKVLGITSKGARSRAYRALARLRLSPEVADDGE